MDWLLLLVFAKAFCIGYGVLYAFAATVHTGRPLVITKKSLLVALDSGIVLFAVLYTCLLYTSPSPRDATLSRMPSSA